MCSNCKVHSKAKQWIPCSPWSYKMRFQKINNIIVHGEKLFRWWLWICVSINGKEMHVESHGKYTHGLFGKGMMIKCQWLRSVTCLEKLYSQGIMIFIMLSVGPHYNASFGIKIYDDVKSRCLLFWHSLLGFPSAFISQAILCFCNKIRLCNVTTWFHYGKPSTIYSSLLYIDVIFSRRLFNKSFIAVDALQGKSKV